jgi:hypothetical protein
VKRLECSRHAGPFPPPSKCGMLAMWLTFNACSIINNHSHIPVTTVQLHASLNRHEKGLTNAPFR